MTQPEIDEQRKKEIGSRFGRDMFNDFDIDDPRFNEHFFDILDDMVEHCPVVRSNVGQGYWMVTRQADVLIAAIGRAEFVTADMVKPGAVVIDVGVNRVADATKKSGYRLTGDVHFPTVSPLCSKITPVPGGVGPMTVAMLMQNTVKARRQNA